MNNKYKYLFVLIFFVCILSISAISATENTTDKEVIKTSNNKESNLETINYQDDDVSNSNENVELKEKETVNEDRYGKSGTDKTTAENEDPLTFNDLNNAINDNTDSTIYLSHNYKYNSASDSGFTNGITISRDLNIYGNGVTIDGNNMARIFYVTDSNLNVNFYNINFINGRSGTGGAIYRGNAYNCNFTNNFATDLDYKGGGAIAYGSAYNCIFTQNKANEYGGEIYSAPDIAPPDLSALLLVNVQLYAYPQLIAPPPIFALFWVKLQLNAFPQHIAPPSLSALFSVNVQLVALPLYIAPPFSAVLLVNIQLVALHM